MTLWTKLHGGVLRNLRVTKVRRFAAQQSGSTSVEFALVALPFLGLMFAILETALVFFAGLTLETAVGDTGRLIMTGQAQQQGFDQGKFKEAVCAKIGTMFDCTNKLHIDVKSYKTVPAVDVTKPLDKGKLVDNFAYQPGCSGDIVLVRVMYSWPVWVSLLGFNLSDMSDGRRLLVATSAFRNEPFSSQC